MNLRKIIWTPSIERKKLINYVTLQWLRDERGLKFADFQELWDWSVNDLETFWKSIWDYFKLNLATAIFESA